LGIIGFTLQIYFDFSGYTDMAIGLGQVIGFKLPENFIYPYTSRSITEFWRRWHLTLSNWFRDYVFYPLERERKKSQRGTQAANVLIVFSLTGLWHGVTLNFLAWGLLQGLLIVFEQSPLGKKLVGRAGQPIQHLYALTAILAGWVVFRTTNLAHAGWYFLALFGFGKGDGIISYYSMPLFEIDFWITMFLGILFSIPLGAYLLERMKKYGWLQHSAVQAVGNLVILLLVLISTSFILTSVSQMSLYAKF
jgi:alginate O-acetyltransferase complex protein AlgI